MLGTNDFQSMHKLDAEQSAQGISAIIAAVCHAPVEPGMQVPRIMVIAPPAITDPKGTMAERFEGGVQRSQGLSAEYEKVAFNNRCILFDAGAVVKTSPIDGVHLDVDQHLTLGQALASPIEAALFGDE
jgi:lysophospholipase L1-like esterase